MSPRFVGNANSSLPALSDISMSETPASDAADSSVTAENEKSRDILNDVKVKADNLSTSLKSYRGTQQERHVAIEGNLIPISRGLFSRFGLLKDTRIITSHPILLCSIHQPYRLRENQ